MSIRCKSCGKFIWSFSTTLCSFCQQEEINSVYRNQDFYRPAAPSPRFALRGKDSPVAVRDVASVDYTPPDTTSWFSSAVSDTSSYSCSDSGSSGGCD